MTSTDSHATDPYASLEDGSDSRTIAWQRAHNAAARAALDAVPHRATMRERFDRLTRAGWLGAPIVRGERTFLWSRTGSQEQPRLSLVEATGDRVLLDPAAIDPSGLTAVDWSYPSPQGRYVAYGLSRNGDEMSTLHLLDVTGATEAAETIPHTRWASVAWLPDETGFYYTAHPDGTLFDQRLCFHRLGTPHEHDRVVFGGGRPPDEVYDAEVSADGRWLRLGAMRGWSESDIFLADLRSPGADGALVTVVAKPGVRASARTSAAGLVVLTNDGAPNGRVALVDPERPDVAYWQEVIPEGEDAIHFASPVRTGVLVGWLHDVTARLALRSHDGRLHDVPLGIASIGEIESDASSTTAYVMTTTHFTPASVMALDLGESGVTARPWRELAPVLDATAYASTQTWFVSKDGTRVPMFVLARRDTPRDGTAPAIVYGYGGFDIALTPDYAPSAVPWLDAGGIYAVANLRGGGEFGASWHLAGMRERKQNVFDDYAAAIEHLGRSGFADPARVAALGGSNGGLLVGALATQRPELVRAVVCLVPVLDMLRYHVFSIGRFWIPEFGDPGVPADAEFLRAYSPYANVREGARYPAMLVVSAMSDSRVDPMHARKFVAKIEASAAPGSGPAFCFIEDAAGHGQGKPRHKQLDELVDRYAFLAWQLDVDPARLAGVDAEPVAAR